MPLLSPIYALYIQYRVIQNGCQGFNNLPPCSPDVTPCDFFLWGNVKDQVYVPPLPASPRTEGTNQNAIETITANMLQTVWNELDYRVDVHRITECIYRAPVRYVTKTWSVVLLNKKIHILLSEVYCV